MPRVIIRMLFAALALQAVPSLAEDDENEAPPAVVHFPSLDGKTSLAGYVFEPTGFRAGRVPGIVMMHGRAGAYSTAAHGEYDAKTLSRRHAFWGHYWAALGYVAVLVDGFGPRGYPQGFPIHSYKQRPEAVNEVTVRPLDAYGALRYLKSRPDVDGERIALQGWSNGGSATIASLAAEALTANGLKPEDKFKGAVAFYPACELHGRFGESYHPYAPIRVFSGDNDEEVSAKRCAQLIDLAKADGGDADITIYPGATHGFDDPNPKRQSVPENADAAMKAITAASAFIRKLFRH